MQFNKFLLIKMTLIKMHVSVRFLQSRPSTWTSDFMNPCSVHGWQLFRCHKRFWRTVDIKGGRDTAFPPTSRKQDVSMVLMCWLVWRGFMMYVRSQLKIFARDSRGKYKSLFSTCDYPPLFRGSNGANFVLWTIVSSLLGHCMLNTCSKSKVITRLVLLVDYDPKSLYIGTMI